MIRSKANRHTEMREEPLKPRDPMTEMGALVITGSAVARSCPWDASFWSGRRFPRSGYFLCAL